MRPLTNIETNSSFYLTDPLIRALETTVKKLMLALLLLSATNAQADEGILGAIGSALLGNTQQNQQQFVTIGTLVRGENGQEYIAVSQGNGQSSIEPVFVQRQQQQGGYQGQGGYAPQQYQGQQQYQQGQGQYYGR